MDTRLARRTLLATAAAAAGTALTGCGSNDKTGGRKAGEKISLTFWSWIPGVDAAVDLWNKANPDVQVHLEKVVAAGGAQYTKMHAALKAGKAPDLVQMEYQTIPEFLLDKGLVDLTKHGIDAHRAKFDSTAWQQVSFAGGVYGVPEDADPMGLFYRADLFDRWGITPPETWAQFETAAAAVRRADPKAYITAFPPTNAGWFTGLCWQAGARWFGTDGDAWVVDIDNAKSRQVAAMWDRLRAGNLVKTEPDQKDAWFADVQAGRIASWICAEWGDATLVNNAATTSGKWRVAPMPVWQAGTSASANWGGSSTALTTGTKYPEDALAFALWLSTNRKSIAILGKGYGRPAVTSSVAGNAFTKPTAFFGGQDYDKIFAQASAVVDKKWIWIPTITTTYQHLRDAFGDVVAGKSTLVDAIGVIHRNTVADLKAKGLTVKEK